MRQYRINLTTDQGLVLGEWSVAVLTPEEAKDDEAYEELDERGFNAVLVEDQITEYSFDSRDQGVGSMLLYEIIRHLKNPV